MQHLAMTCKILYDKNYLDNMSLLKKKKNILLLFLKIFLLILVQ